MGVEQVLESFLTEAGHAVHAYLVLGAVFYLGQAAALELGFGRAPLLRWLAVVAAEGPEALQRELDQPVDQLRILRARGLPTLWPKSCLRP